MFTCLAIIYSSTWIGALRCRLNRLTKYLRAPCRTSIWYSRISKLIAGPTACLSVGTNLISTTLSKIRSCGIKEVNLIKTWRDTIKIYLLSLIFHIEIMLKEIFTWCWFHCKLYTLSCSCYLIWSIWFWYLNIDSSSVQNSLLYVWICSN